MNESKQREESGVLVVGAGPTGLTLASCLAEFEVPFAIVERRERVPMDSKALGINVLSQYLFELVGLDGVLGAAGERAARMNVYWQDRRLNAVDFRRLPSPIRAFITQPQWMTESELEASLARSGARVRRGEELVALEEEGSAVVATLHKGDRAMRERYAFVAGCDGKTSRVRQYLGVPMRGFDYPMHFVLGDFEVTADRLTRNVVHYFVYEDTFVIFAPLDAGRWRVVVKQDGPCPPGAPPASAITEPVERRFGERMFRTAPSWISRAPFYMRVTDSLGGGRVYLAGDAAHLFSPIGGTGMNTGMQDAFNLAWKLAYAYHGRARGDALLRSYSEERIEAIHRTAAMTDLSTRLIAREERSEALVRPYLPDLRNRRAVARDLPMAHSGLAVAYTASSAVRGEIPGGGRAQPGRVVLGLPILRRALAAAGLPVSPSDLLLVAVADPRADAAALRVLAAVVAAIEARHGRWCRAAVVVPAGSAAAEHAEGTPVVGDAALERQLALPPRSVCLVRPDGVMGWGAALSGVEGVLGYLDAVLGQRAGEKAVA